MTTTTQIAAAQALKTRESQVIKRMAAGLTDRAIGEDLGISHGTVRTYVNRIYAALDVNSRAQAAVIADRAGILDSNG